MGKEKKSKKSRRRSRSPTPSSDSDASSRSRSRSRSRDRSSRSRRGSSKRTKRESRSRSRTPSRERDRERKKRKRSPTPSRSRSRSRTPKRERGVKSEPSDNELRRIKEEEKARLKANETPEERAARRAAKKALKHGGSLGESVSGVVEKQFVWKKKYEKNIAEGVETKILTRAELAAKQVALQDEIAAIKARKIARAEEKEQMDALRESMAREAEAENIEGWEEKEEEFHRANAAMRTAIRIKEGREKLVDVLAKNRLLYRQLKRGPTAEEREEHPEYLGATLDPNLPPESDIELTEAHKLLTGGDVPWRDLEHLLKDIEAVRHLERDDVDYWSACAALTKASIDKQKTAAFAAGAQMRAAGGYGAPMPPPAAAAKSSSDALKDEMASVLRGKSLAELCTLDRDISSLLAGERPAALAHLESMDHNYWYALKTELVHFQHIAYLREFHVDLLELRLKDLQTYITREEERTHARREQERAERIARGEPEEEVQQATADDAEEDEFDFEPPLIPHAEFHRTADATGDEEEEDGSFSPVLVPDDDDALDKHASAARAIAAIDPEADARELAEQRRLVADQKQREQEERAKLAAGSAVTALVSADTSSSAAPAAAADDAAFRRESSRGLEGDEIQLRSDFALPGQTYWWFDKYRPRKPRFFNRVKTGFEWNKYNSSHFDKENPPPKIVQGYKFNIFYPDLIDPSVAPRYRIEPDPGGNPDFCIIRFMAGPPYEDLAFKIVKKEWEHSFKRGFKCVFDRGVLALYFNFRRYFYRR